MPAGRGGPRIGGGGDASTNAIGRRREEGAPLLGGTAAAPAASRAVGATTSTSVAAAAAATGSNTTITAEVLDPEEAETRNLESIEARMTSRPHHHHQQQPPPRHGRTVPPPPPPQRPSAPRSSRGIGRSSSSRLPNYKKSFSERQLLGGCIDVGQIYGVFSGADDDPLSDRHLNLSRSRSASSAERELEAQRTRRHSSAGDGLQAASGASGTTLENTKPLPSLRSIARRARFRHRTQTAFDGVLEAIRDDELLDDEYGDYGIADTTSMSIDDDDGPDEDAPLDEQQPPGTFEEGSGGGSGPPTTDQVPRYGSTGVGGGVAVGGGSFDYSSSDEERGGGQVKRQQQQHKAKVRASARQSIARARFRRAWKRFVGGINERTRSCCRRPGTVVAAGGDLLARSAVAWISLPCCALSFFLYYCLGNPELFFLPGEAKLSWWLNFAARQAVTLDLGRISQYVVVDLIMLSPFSVRLFGSVATFFCILSKGWPFVLAAWSAWDLALLQGAGPFRVHWLHWTGLRIFSQEANSGAYILSSEPYLRTLVAMIFLAVVAAAKRTALAVQFGRRQLVEFKPQLEKILKDVSLISELSYLAEETEAFAESGVAFDLKELSAAVPKGAERMGLQSNAVAFDEDDLSENSSDDVIKPGDDGSLSDVLSDVPTGKSKGNKRSDQLLNRTSSGNISIKESLDRWEEPRNKADKSFDVTIHDVVKFRRVLSFLDETRPFGEAFGPAANRDECLDSAHNLYWRLLKLTPGASTIPFSTIALVAAYGDRFDEGKKRALRRLFRPDVDDALPLVPFVQSIDTVYKKIRYFRASVGNASVIDNVLEKIINGVFYFIVSLILLSFLQINPWPLLVSMTSVLVSVSFALGPSVSKYVEGALLIAIRRPYDLGDRIFFTDPQTSENPGPLTSWFVEDINLASTTLRYATTNEVSSVSNSSIEASRIVNCNRSPSAIIIIPNLELHVKVLEDDNLTAFQDRLNAYVREHPRAWDHLLYCRVDEVDADNEKIKCTLAFRHRNSWQDAGRILVQKGLLLKFVYETASQLGVDFNSPPSRRLLYSGGVLIDGQRGEGGYKANLLNPDNIRNPSQMFGLSFIDRQAGGGSLPEQQGSK